MRPPVALGAIPGGPGVAAQFAGRAFAPGILLFSGLLYAMVYSGVRASGAITPPGGAALIPGWVALAVAAAALNQSGWGD